MSASRLILVHDKFGTVDPARDGAYAEFITEKVGVNGYQLRAAVVGGNWYYPGYGVQFAWVPADECVIFEVFERNYDQTWDEGEYLLYLANVETAYHTVQAIVEAFAHERDHYIGLVVLGKMPPELFNTTIDSGNINPEVIGAAAREI